MICPLRSTYPCRLTIIPRDKVELLIVINSRYRLVIKSLDFVETNCVALLDFIDNENLSSPVLSITLIKVLFFSHSSNFIANFQAADDCEISVRVQPFINFFSVLCSDIHRFHSN